MKQVLKLQFLTVEGFVKENEAEKTKGKNLKIECRKVLLITTDGDLTVGQERL